MKTILCFGDSNTWGYNPVTQDRFPFAERWVGVLTHELSEGYLVIPEGQNGRTTVWDDPVDGGHKNGQWYLIPCLESHKPIDLVIILLGVNDLKKRFSVSAYDVANSAGLLVELVQKSDAGPNDAAPQILLVAPPPIARLSGYAEMFEGAEPKSRKLAGHYRRVTEEQGCYFMDAGQIIVSSDLDGIHFEASEHAKLGKALASQVRRLFEN